jgi:S-(hydroxymethyl)glutathione dehydrogenase / alcohol dehydrogenase
MPAARTVTAAVLEAVDAELAIDDSIELLPPGPGQVLVRVHHCGLCHSDVSVMTGVAPAPMPVILGHEASGVVAEVGPGVTTLAPGDHVMLTPIPPCGRCHWCVRAQHSLCVNNIGLMTQTLPDGSTNLRRNGSVVYQGLGVAGFADHTVVLESGAVKIPDDVPLEIVTVIGCAVQTGVGAVLNTAKVEPGSSVLVLGAGGIGIAIVQGARLAGASRIVVSDPNPDRREAARRFGATDVVDPGAADVAEACRGLTGGIGVDYAFEAVGSSALARAGVDASRNGGTTVLVGAGPIDETLDISRILMMVTEKKITGCLLGSVNPHREIPRLIDFWQRGMLDLESMVTARRPLSEINQAVADMGDGVGLRTILSP